MKEPITGLRVLNTHHKHLPSPDKEQPVGGLAPCLPKRCSHLCLDGGLWQKRAVLVSKGRTPACAGFFSQINLIDIPNIQGQRLGLAWMRWSQTLLHLILTSHFSKRSGHLVMLPSPGPGYPGAEMWTGLLWLLLGIKKSLRWREWNSAHRIIYVGNAQKQGILLRKKKKTRVRKEMLQVVITQTMQGKGSFVFPVLAILLSQTFIPLMAPKPVFWSICPEWGQSWDLSSLLSATWLVVLVSGRGAVQSLAQGAWHISGKRTSL